LCKAFWAGDSGERAGATGTGVDMWRDCASPAQAACAGQKRRAAQSVALKIKGLLVYKN
jgi:hypothetical protein